MSERHEGCELLGGVCDCGLRACALGFCGFCKGQPVGNAARWINPDAPPYAACPRCGETNNPADEPEKGEPMEASGSTTTTGNANPAAETEKETEKEKREPTERQVFELVLGEDGKPVKGPRGGEVWEKIGKPCTGSRRESIGDAMDELGETTGTFMAPPTRSIQTESPGTEQVTKRVW